MSVISRQRYFDMQECSDKQASIVFGMGVSGVSVAHYLSAAGRDFVLADTREFPPNFETLNTEYGTCPKYFGDLQNLDVEGYSELVLSPGLARTEPLVQRALRAGVTVIGDIELFYRAARAPIIAITGSNGKSSVVTLVTEILNEAGLTAYCGGNIGVPALDLLARPTPDFYVLEVSSFQLETIDRFAPKIAALLNVSPDHMDRYASYEEYVSAKLNIFRHAEYCVINRTEKTIAASLSGSGVVGFGARSSETDNYVLASKHGKQLIIAADKHEIDQQKIRLQGGHNLENVLAALAITDLAGVPHEVQERVLTRFEGLEHRTEVVGTWRNIQWINDSKGTNVGATLAAIRGCVKNAEGILIAGGVGKGADFSPLKTVVDSHLKAVILFGQDAHQIANAIGGLRPIYFAPDLAAAIDEAKRRAEAGDTVLFSPACASFDMFENYQHRGNEFKRLVREANRT